MQSEKRSQLLRPDPNLITPTHKNWEQSLTFQGKFGCPAVTEDRGVGVGMGVGLDSRESGLGWADSR